MFKKIVFIVLSLFLYFTHVSAYAESIKLDDTAVTPGGESSYINLWGKLTLGVKYHISCDIESPEAGSMLFSIHGYEGDNFPATLNDISLGNLSTGGRSGIFVGQFGSLKAGENKFAVDYIQDERSKGLMYFYLKDDYSFSHDEVVTIKNCQAEEAYLGSSLTN